MPKLVLRLLLCAVLAVTLGGCTSESEPDGPKVIQPGAPGEPNRSGDPDIAASSNEWTHTDLAFMQMMIPHHYQALEMSDLARKHARTKAVRILAERIRGAQAPEIQAMSSWLDERNLEVPRAGEDPKKYDHSRLKRLIEEGAVEKRGETYTFTRDYQFNSPSAAASFVLGRNARPKAWKFESGRALA